MELTQEQLKQILNYDKSTGMWIWLVDIFSGKNNKLKSAEKGNVAGTLSKIHGYRIIGINGKKYRAHRLVWLYEYGYWPKYQIDHINHIKDDNRIVNLREVTHEDNQRNMSKSKNNKSGHTGVVWDKSVNKWRAEINIKNKSITLGRFINKEDAIKCRKQAEIKYKFHENHGKE